MKSGQLPQLIQGMYGAVLGVSIIRISDKLLDGDINGKIVDFTKGETLFQLFFSLFTLAIATHDWYSFHRAHDNKFRTFPNYLIQIFTIFCIGQMFIYANLNGFFFWYLFGFVYAVLNFIRLRIFEKKRPYQYIFIHFLIASSGTAVGFFTGSHSMLKLIYLLITIFVVCVIWYKNDKKQNVEFNKVGEFEISTPISKDGTKLYTLILKDFDYKSKKEELAKFAILSGFYEESYEGLKAEFPNHIDFLEGLKKSKEDTIKPLVKEVVASLLK
jgi:hypothetical protein